MNRLLATVSLLASLLVLPVAHAQSAEDAPEVATEEPAGEPSPVDTSQAPSPMSVYAYLQTADGMPARFATWETNLSETLRLYRLGAMSEAEAEDRLSMLIGAAHLTAARLQQIVPPPQLAWSNSLNISAANEYAAAFELGLRVIQGDSSVRDAANSHFAQAQDYASQAAHELR